MSLPTEINGRETPARDGSALEALIDFYRAFNASDLEALAANWAEGDAPSMDNPIGGIRRGWPAIKESCLAGQRPSAWHSTISQRKGTMIIISSLDAKKVSAKLPLFGSSFEFARPGGSSRCMAHGGSSITMAPSMSPHCWLTTSERFLEQRSGRRHSYVKCFGAKIKCRRQPLWVNRVRSMVLAAGPLWSQQRPIGAPQRTTPTALGGHRYQLAANTFATGRRPHRLCDLLHQFVRSRQKPLQQRRGVRAAVAHNQVDRRSVSL
jgi:hypothetical protein